MAKGSADVPCVLRRESANLIGLEGVAKGSADVPCVLGREPANLIRLKVVTKGSANVPCVLGRESANLIGLKEAAKVIPNEPDIRYNEMEMVDNVGTNRVEVGDTEQESGKILAKPATDVAG